VCVEGAVRRGRGSWQSRWPLPKIPPADSESHSSLILGFAPPPPLFGRSASLPLRSLPSNRKAVLLVLLLLAPPLPLLVELGLARPWILPSGSAPLRPLATILHGVNACRIVLHQRPRLDTHRPVETGDAVLHERASRQA